MDLLHGLNPKQIEAVKAVKGPVLVIAGAGSGKTRTLTHRIAYMVAHEQIPAYNILAVTFTNKAAGEMKERVGELLRLHPSPPNRRARVQVGPMMGTFHSVCVRILREDIGVLGYKRTFNIYDTDDQLKVIKSVMKDLSYSVKDFNPKKVHSTISSAKNRFVSPSEFSHEAQGMFQEITAQIYDKYQDKLKEMHALDFDDLLIKVVELWQKNPEILEKYQDRWPYILIDEYQDTNHVQYLWSKLLAAKHKNVFVVGDSAQSIYLWRGADVSNILDFEKDYPDARIIKLEQNYRSTKAILAVSNVVIKRSDYHKDRELWTENDDGVLPVIIELEDERSEAEFVLGEVFGTSRGVGRESPAENELSYDYSDSEESPLSGGILGTIISQNIGQPGFSGSGMGQGMRFSKKLHDAIQQQLPTAPLNDHVILYRTNAQSRVIEEVMLDYGVPYRIIGGIRFYSRQEIKDILAYLRVLVNPSDLVSFERILNVPTRGIGNKTLAAVLNVSQKYHVDPLTAIRKYPGELGLSDLRVGNLQAFASIFSELERLIEGMTVVDIIDLIAKKAGYYKYLKDGTEEGEERYRNVQELKTAAKKYAQLQGVEAVAAFLEEVALIADIDNYQPDEAPAITLMTIHSAKGLEFPCVFMAGMEEGLFPHSSSMMDPEEYEEERRLCYVGMTRAKDKLFLAHTRVRQLYGNTQYNMESQFIRELGDDVVERRVV